MPRACLAILFSIVLLLPPSSHAFGLSSVKSWADGVGANLGNIYDNGTSDAFVSGYTWHDPGTYTAAKRAELNSHAWGLGWGKHIEDAHGNDQMVYAMVFSDSHWNAEPVIGYAKQWQWRPFDGDFKLGAGYTAAITSRADLAKNFPIPIALPLLSVGYRGLTLYSVLIPRFNGSPNNGNVAFLFLRYAY
ncbi:Lipid A palmitoyltransferase PagP [Thiomonas sp. X19]|uniref:lipid IV(A) palmitoyltransferase PagP n=1 Tax=Thiomonas sp. X19 TaxID=1050370 RepID=UPI000B6730E2|nr:peptide ABC transporter permease [Thiomonas sp. X19]SCC95417.1 Lipid A palmitoyltransferase PagP [Thiomonas sp. X19]